MADKFRLCQECLQRAYVQLFNGTIHDHCLFLDIDLVEERIDTDGKKYSQYIDPIFCNGLAPIKPMVTYRHFKHWLDKGNKKYYADIAKGYVLCCKQMKLPRSKFVLRLIAENKITEK